MAARLLLLIVDRVRKGEPERIFAKPSVVYRQLLTERPNPATQLKFVRAPKDTDKAIRAQAQQIL